MSKVMEWIQKRPKLFGQKGKWEIDPTREIATWPKPMSVLSGPEHPLHPARAFLRQVFPPYDRKLVESFLTRFRGQKGKGFQGMAVFEVEGLLSGIGQRRKERQRPKKVDEKGMPMSIIG